MQRRSPQLRAKADTLKADVLFAMPITVPSEASAGTAAVQFSSGQPEGRAFKGKKWIRHSIQASGGVQVTLHGETRHTPLLSELLQKDDAPLLPELTRLESEIVDSGTQGLTAVVPPVPSPAL